jgi:hypothetical protein
VAQPRDIEMHPPRRNNKAHSFVYFHTVTDAARCLQALKVRRRCNTDAHCERQRCYQQRR